VKLTGVILARVTVKSNPSWLEYTMFHMEKQQKLVLVVSILGSFVAFLDGSVVIVALPAISRELGGGLSAQQWIVDAYILTLGVLILLAGSLSDLFGRKRILAFGLIGFALTSLLCAVAPNTTFLSVARGLQGIAGALLVPSSLALIISTFHGSAQGKAIGTWTAWTGISFVIGPLVGGFLVDVSSWRLIFAINLLPIVITLWLMSGLEKVEHIQQTTSVDVVGASLCIAGLSGSVFALIEQPRYGWGSPIIYVTFILGLIFLATFISLEAHSKKPMLPLSVFRVRNFSVGNIATATIYGGLAVSTFLIVIYLQQVANFSALHAGLAMLPVTIVMFVLSPRFGALAGKFGPRWFMAIGPVIAAGGFLLMLRVQHHIDYITQLLPGVLVFALGLSATVAPLTSAVLGDVNAKHAGIA
jgi:EmrB/QacA subfamily drug resistance transporter